VRRGRSDKRARARLLSYLHNAGIVFYRPGLFDDRIILDQAWALEAIYTVFNRESCYRPLRYLRGRFNREILEALVWREYKISELEVFLGMMRSCGICFVHRRGTGNGTETKTKNTSRRICCRSTPRSKLNLTRCGIKRLRSRRWNSNTRCCIPVSCET
jgi:hypothetical protein